MVAVQRNVRVNPERWDESQRAGEAVGGAIPNHLAHCSAIYHVGLASTYVVVCAVYLRRGMWENGFPGPHTGEPVYIINYNLFTGTQYFCQRHLKVFRPVYFN